MSVDCSVLNPSVVRVGDEVTLALAFPWPDSDSSRWGERENSGYRGRGYS